MISNEEVKIVEKCVMGLAHQDSVPWIQMRGPFRLRNVVSILKELPLYKSEKQIKKKRRRRRRGSTYGILVVILNDVTMVQASSNIVTAVSDDTFNSISVVYPCSECGYRCAFIVPKAFHFVSEWTVSRADE